MMTLTFAIAMALQAGGQRVAVIENDNPETWAVEYPRIIRPFVLDYRKCLNIADRRVRGKADFEQQHAADLPRCEEERATAIAQSNESMLTAKTRIGPKEVDQLFENIGLIHIARGRDLDNQFRMRVEAANKAAAFDKVEDGSSNATRALVVELFDASEIQAQTLANAEAEAKAAAALEANVPAKPTGVD